MVSFQVIFSGNEDELYRFVITWKMMADTKRYDIMKKQVEEVENRLKELRREVKKLEEKRRKLQREVAELTSLKETLQREVAGFKPEAVPRP